MSQLTDLLTRIEESGIPRRVLMEQAGLSYHAFNSWERGERTPRKSSLRKIAEALRGYASAHVELADELERLAG
jgi:transcriptional regulator with XRE-family HTH domain